MRLFTSSLRNSNVSPPLPRTTGIVFRLATRDCTVQSKNSIIPDAENNTSSFRRRRGVVYRLRGAVWLIKGNPARTGPSWGPFMIHLKGGREICYIKREGRSLQVEEKGTNGLNASREQGAHCWTSARTENRALVPNAFSAEVKVAYRLLKERK